MRRDRAKRKVKQPLVIDMFTGVGGLSLGAARAGMSVIGGIDNNPMSLETHAFNFPATHHFEAEVERLSGGDLLRNLGLRRYDLDGLIGGPPCQGFSEIGHRSKDDPRNLLFDHFFRLVAEIRPKFFVVENVPGILAARYEGIREAAFARLPKCYEVAKPLTVKANDLGAPTSRTRVFFIGADTGRMPSLRDLPIRTLIGDQVTVGQALIGLPAVRSAWQDDLRSWRLVGDTPRDSFFRRIRGHIPPGVGNEVALYFHRRERLTSGCLGTQHTRATVKRFSRLRPGEVDPVSGATRLDSKGLCPTIRAGTGPERGSYQAVRPIHPRSPRVITPREAARLQGFPDWFVFHPTKWHSFRQIGNSVSPIVAEAILKAINDLLTDRRV